MFSVKMSAVISNTGVTSLFIKFPHRNIPNYDHTSLVFYVRRTTDHNLSLSHQGLSPPSIHFDILSNKQASVWIAWHLFAMFAVHICKHHYLEVKCTITTPTLRFKFQELRCQEMERERLVYRKH